MEDLKVIWGKLNDLQIEVGKLVEVDSVTSIYNKLKKEEANRKKWMPWMIPYILLMMAVITWVTEAYKGMIPMFGIALITVGGFLMMWLLSRHQISVEAYEHDKNATVFLTSVKDKLVKRKTSWAIGVALYILLLLGGLHLLIFGLDSLAGKGGMLGLLYGTMLGLMGYATGSMYLRHQKQYGDTLKMIDRFLKDE